jgi:hypothetical protein
MKTDYGRFMGVCSITRIYSRTRICPACVAPARTLSSLSFNGYKRYISIMFMHTSAYTVAGIEPTTSNAIKIYVFIFLF